MREMPKTWICAITVLFLVAVSLPYILPSTATYSIHTESKVSVSKRKYDVREELQRSIKFLQRRIPKDRIQPGDGKVLTLWSTDFHISPVADAKGILNSVDAQVKVHDKSLSGACASMGTCAEDLRHINHHNGQTLGTCPNDLRRKFYDFYSHDDAFTSVDAIICQHAASLCELYMPFNRTLVVVASTRYELGRGEETRWHRWNDNLRRIAARDHNVVAANNIYDMYYIQYFTGIENVILLPSTADHVKGIQWTYPQNTPSQSQSSIFSKAVLLAPKHLELIPPELKELLKAALADHNENANAHLEIVPIRHIYPHRFEYDDLASHPAVVLLPYQVSIMTFYEFYRMGVPIFVPSIDLLSKSLISGFYDGRLRQNAIPGLFTHDPNNEFSQDAVRAWVKLSDYYTWPHVTTFDSFDHLVTMLSCCTSTGTLQQTSRKMQQFMGEVADITKDAWTAVLQGVEEDRRSRAYESTSSFPSTMDEALWQQYARRLPKGKCFEEE
eukprot:GSChrysophyteH1.ASY1.ANO1.1567.1 assembled CDS